MGAGDNTLMGQSFEPQSKPDNTGFVSNVRVTGTTGNHFEGALPARDKGYNQLELHNQTTGWAYLNLGGADAGHGQCAAADNTCYPVGPGVDKVITIKQNHTNYSVFFTAAGDFVMAAGEGL